MFKLTGALSLLLIFSLSTGCSHFGYHSGHHGHSCGESHCSADKKDSCKDHSGCKDKCSCKDHSGCKDGSCGVKDEKK